MSSFTIKQDDTRPTLRMTLQTPLLVPPNLTGTEVFFSMGVSREAIPKINSVPALIVDAPNGVVEYVWAPGDTGDPGEYDAEFTVIDGGELTTYPNDEYIVVKIMRRV